jgi:drug/metabolite transporter (DMT)-like permease
MLFLTAGQIFQKLGADRHVADTHGPGTWYRTVRSPEILRAAICMCTGLIVWLFVLYRTDVSRAFPMLSLTSVLVLAVSRVYLREPVSLRRWGGALLVTLGVALVSAS